MGAAHHGVATCRDELGFGSPDAVGPAGIEPPGSPRPLSRNSVGDDGWTGVVRELGAQRVGSHPWQQGRGRHYVHGMGATEVQGDLGRGCLQDAIETLDQASCDLLAEGVVVVDQQDGGGGG